MPNPNTYSQGLQAWLAENPRFDISLDGTNKPDAQAYWESALMAGAVHFIDLRIAPKHYFKDAISQWVNIADFDVHSDETWRIIRHRYQTTDAFALHNLWYAWSAKQKWSSDVLSENVGKWTQDKLATLLNDGKTEFKINVDSWMSFLNNLARFHPNEHIEKAYLTSLHLLASGVGNTPQELGQFKARMELEDAVEDWWDRLSSDRRDVLQQWCEQHRILPAPKMLEDWLLVDGPTRERVENYLSVIDLWWGTKSKSGVIGVEGEAMHIQKITRLTKNFGKDSHTDLWLPYLGKWYTSKTCEALWRDNAATRLHGDIYSHVKKLSKGNVLRTLFEKRASLQERFFEARKELKYTERLSETPEWLEMGPADPWSSALWAEIVQEKVSNAKFIGLLIKGHDAGYPLDAELKLKLWLRHATNSIKPTAVLLNTIKEHYSLPEDFPNEEVMDAWLQNWFPGQGKLLSAAVSLGIDENPKELKQYLLVALKNTPNAATALPVDFDVNFSF